MTETNPVSETVCMRNLKLMDNVQTMFLFIVEHAVTNLKQYNEAFHCASAICKPPHPALAANKLLTLKVQFGRRKKNLNR